MVKVHTEDLSLIYYMYYDLFTTTYPGEDRVYSEVGTYPYLIEVERLFERISAQITHNKLKQC